LVIDDATKKIIDSSVNEDDILNHNIASMRIHLAGARVVDTNRAQTSSASRRRGS
jgi:hypothetical protein